MTTAFWPLDHLRIDLKAVGGAEVGVNFDGSELVDEDGPHAAWRRRILCGGRVTLLCLFMVRRRSCRRAPSDEREQCAGSEPEKARTGQSGLRHALRTRVT